MTAQRMRLPDGRWHFHHGPMDIVIGAEGRPDAADAAHDAAWSRFRGILDELVAELPLLRSPISSPIAGPSVLNGPIARRMWSACQPHAASFITPMASVAGAVAEELIACYAKPGITRAWANNGGDIALHLAAGQAVRIGLFSNLSRLDALEVLQGVTTDGQFDVTSALPVRGVATSGWRGRSLSRGIADSVTVLARTASQADAAATVIANAVNIDHPQVVRRPACEVKDNSDLGKLLVTVEVPTLHPRQVLQALQAGLARANALQASEHLWSAVLVCQSQIAVTANTPFNLPASQCPGRPVGWFSTCLTNP